MFAASEISTRHFISLRRMGLLPFECLATLQKGLVVKIAGDIHQKWPESQHGRASQ